MADGIATNIRGVREFDGALKRMTRDVDLATIRALKTTQKIAKTSIRRKIKGRPRWDRRGKSSRTGAEVNLNLSPHVAPKGGGPGSLTGTLRRGIGGVRRPRRTLGGFKGGVGVGGGVRNLYKKRVEGEFPYFKPGLDAAEPKMHAVWVEEWGRAVR